MISFDAVWLTQVANYRTALKDADALYAEFDPYPRIPSTKYLSEVVDDYQQIVAKYGAVPGAEAGIGKCLFLQGRYEEAAKAFKLAGPKYLSRNQEALEYAEASQAIHRQRQAFKVRQLRHLPGNDRWIALLYESLPKTKRQERLIVQFDRKLGTNLFHQIGKAKDLGEFIPEEDRSALYLTRLSLHDRDWRVLFFSPGYMVDCSFVYIQILSIGASGLKTIRTFDPSEGASFKGPTAKHGLLVKQAPFFHVSWSDLYEWRGGRFVLANRQFPRLFELDKDPEPPYPNFRSRPGYPGPVWRSQNRLAQGSQGMPDVHLASRHPYRDADRYGNARTNLREIRLRLKWLARKEYNHTLLYRPTSRWR